MNANSAAGNNESGLQSDLNRYKQAAEVAYRYVKTQAEDQKAKDESSFGEDTKKEPTQDKETG
jgi:hypothetical protein